MSRACIELQKIMDQLADWQRRYGGRYVSEESMAQSDARI